jgi:hypothetical protein
MAGGHPVNYWVGGIQVKPGEKMRDEITGSWQQPVPPGNRNMIAPSRIYEQLLIDNFLLYQLTHVLSRYSCKVAAHLAVNFAIHNSFS